MNNKMVIYCKRVLVERGEFAGDVVITATR